MSDELLPMPEGRLARALREPAVVVLGTRRPRALVYRLRVKIEETPQRRACRAWCLFVCRCRAQPSMALLTVRWWLLGRRP